MGIVGVYRGSYYDIFGTPRLNGYFAEKWFVEPLLGDRRTLLCDLLKLAKLKNPKILDDRLFSFGLLGPP